MNDEEIVSRFERESFAFSPINKRAFAYFIDELIVSVFFMIIFWESFQTSQDMEQMAAMINSVFYYVILLKVIYHTFFVWMYAATPGKLLMKMRVIDVQYMERPNLIQALLRAVMRMVSETLFYLGFIWAFFNPVKATWHDRFAKTLVIDV